MGCKSVQSVHIWNMLCTRLRLDCRACNNCSVLCIYFCVWWLFLVRKTTIATSLLQEFVNLYSSVSLEVNVFRARILVAAWCTVPLIGSSLALYRPGILEYSHWGPHRFVHDRLVEGLKNILADLVHAGVNWPACIRGSFSSLKEGLQFYGTGLNIISCSWFGQSKFPAECCVGRIFQEVYWHYMFFEIGKTNRHIA